MRDACKRLADAGILVSLFIDADERQIEASRRVGAPAIELHTGRYADATTPTEVADELQRIIDGVNCGLNEGLIVNAGHGLHYHNVEAVAAIKGINELNIGHALVAQRLHQARQIGLGVFSGLRRPSAHAPTFLGGAPPSTPFSAWAVS